MIKTTENECRTDWTDLRRWNWNWRTCESLPPVPRESKQSRMQGSSWSAHKARRLAFAVKLFESLWQVLPQYSECLPCAVITMHNIGHTSMGVIILPKNKWFKYWQWRMERYPYSCIWWNGISWSPWVTQYCNELVINTLTTSAMNGSIGISRQSKWSSLRVMACPRRTLPQRCIYIPALWFASNSLAEKNLTKTLVKIVQQRRQDVHPPTTS